MFTDKTSAREDRRVRAREPRVDGDRVCLSLKVTKLYKALLYTSVL